MADLIRQNFFMSRKEKAILKKMTNLTVSEHIRRAIAEYLERIQSSLVSKSPSK